MSGRLILAALALAVIAGGGLALERAGYARGRAEVVAQAQAERSRLEAALVARQAKLTTALADLAKSEHARAILAADLEAAAWAAPDADEMEDAARLDRLRARWGAKP